MKPRTLQILTALIEDFIETAAPVASKRLLEAKKFDVSSATVRNEFALLEEVGLIHSPHVSAGKIPTQQGYRFFVDELMESDFPRKNDPSDAINKVFSTHLEAYRNAKTKETLFDLIRVAAGISGNIAFATLDNDQTFYLGLSNVLRSPEFSQSPEKAAQIIEILEGRERFLSFVRDLDLPAHEPKIFIGDENILDEVSSCAMVLSKFETKFACGHIGILGPMRMDYRFNQTLIQNLLEMIG